MRHPIAHTDSESTSQPQDGGVFGALLVLLVWAPLPLASNRVWAVGILLLAVVGILLSAAWTWRKHLDLALVCLTGFRLPVGLLAAMVALSWAQTVPVPAAWVAAVSPMAALAQGSAQTMTLSLDVFQSQLLAGRSFIFLSVFLVAVLCVRTNSRLDTLAQVLVWSGVLQAVIGAVLFSVQAQCTLFFVDLLHDRMKGTFVYHNKWLDICVCAFLWE
ncbi:MAG: hypothetical protein WCH60_13870 [Burkholderiales bacterium]